MTTTNFLFSPKILAAENTESLVKALATAIGSALDRIAPGQITVEGFNDEPGVCELRFTKTQSAPSAT